MTGSQVQVFLEPQCPWKASICCREFKKCTHRPVFNSLHIRVTLRFSFANGQEDVSTSVLPVPYLAWKVIFYMRVLNAPGPMLLGAHVREDLGLVVDHVDCSVFLSHLKLDDTVERLPSRHLALSLCAEDVNAQYEAVTPETRELLNHVLQRGEVNPDTNVSLAHAHGYLKISRNPLLRVYRDVPVKDENTRIRERPFSGTSHLM